MSGLILVFAICVLLQGVQGSLRFRQDGTFRIVQFTDLHYGEGEDVSWGPRQDANSNRVLHSVLDHEDVDLVVYTGDLITGNNVHSNATSYWKELLLPSSQRGLKYILSSTNTLIAHVILLCFAHPTCSCLGLQHSSATMMTYRYKTQLHNRSHRESSCIPLNAAYPDRLHKEDLTLCQGCQTTY
eukprot:TRINITY_DN10780_c0_g2_i7.p2 TRINITY_DN10780_c0_g2~~TRINITY_DN10780_c0_g2_i7.p2  ORF type:complete len:185 (+),score=11.12 TRINITY_DN10780_c0_g2_i7:1670-2224(+)